MDTTSTTSTETRNYDGPGLSRPAPLAGWSAPRTVTDYAARLRSSGSGWSSSWAVAHDAARRGFLVDDTAPAPVETADDGAGSGWSVVALLADGTAVVMADAETFGAASDIAADADRLSRSADVYGPNGRPIGWRVVVVPTYDAAALVGSV